MKRSIKGKIQDNQRLNMRPPYTPYHRIWLKSIAIAIVGLFFFQQTALSGGLQWRGEGIAPQKSELNNGGGASSVLGEAVQDVRPIVPRESRELAPGEFRKLLRIAVKHLKEVFNPDEYILDEWEIIEGIINFKFELEDSPVKILIDIETRKPILTEACKIALAARNYLAENAGVNKNKVHINGLVPLSGFRHSKVTARIDNCEIVLNYNNGNPELTSLINEDTGVNLLEIAIAHLLETYDPRDFKLINWRLRLEEGIAGFTFRTEDGSTIGTQVDIATGEPGITWRATPVEGSAKDTHSVELPGHKDNSGSTKGGSVTLPRPKVNAAPAVEIPKRKPLKALEAVKIPEPEDTQTTSADVIPEVENIEAEKLSPSPKKDIEAEPKSSPEKKEIEPEKLSVSDSDIDGIEADSIKRWFKGLFNSDF